MLTACVKICNLPLQYEILRSPDLKTKTVIIYHGEGARPVVFDASPVAGIKPGLALSKAISEYPEATNIRADEGFYQKQWKQLVNGLLKVGDRVEDATQGVAFVAIDGLTKLYNGKERVIEVIAEVPTSQGLVAHVGAAPGRFPAYCAAVRAQRNEPVILDNNPRAVKQFLAPLPVDLLPLDERAIELLHDFAIDTIGELAAQPLSAIQAQLGNHGRRAWDLANGIDHSALNTITEDLRIHETFHFPWPAASMDALSFGIRTLFDRAFDYAQRLGKAVGKMQVNCEMSDAELWSFYHAFKEPTDSSILAHSVVFTHVEALVQSDASPFRNPVEKISVELSRLGTERSEQLALWREHERGDLNTALRQLNAKMNLSPIKTVVDVEPWSRIPERRQALIAVTNH